MLLIYLHKFDLLSETLVISNSAQLKVDCFASLASLLQETDSLFQENCQPEIMRH